jgi:hypothetical protein
MNLPLRPSLFGGNDLDFVTLYWLSGWFGDNYEIWKGKKDLKASTADQAVFPITLVWPLQEEPDASLLVINQRDAQISFTVDWFPGEEFSLEVYRSDSKNSLVLMCTFERETVFLHIK